MKLVDPIAAYNAASNLEALLVQKHLESNGLEAYVTEDHSVVGHWMFGSLPEIHKPQVWISRSDSERVGPLLAEFELSKSERDPAHCPNAKETLEVECEECSKVSEFSLSLNGTLQDCSHCGAYVDVGEFEWPE